MAKAKTTRAAAKDRPIIAIQTVTVTITAAEGEGDAKSPPKFNVTAYTGGALNVCGWDLPVVIDLAGLQFARSVVANLAHNDNQLVGHVTDKTKTDSELNLGGVFSAATPFRDQVVDSAASGFPWEASVEVSPSKIEEIDAGKTVKVNGQEFTGPLYVTRKGTLSAFGFVAHGADPNTEVKIAASAASTEEKKMDPKFKAWIEAMLPGTDIEALSDESVASLKASYDGKNPKRPVQKLDEVIASAEQEEARRQQIADITAQFISDNPQRDGDFIAKIKTLAENAIEAKWTADKYDTELLRASRPQAHTVFATRDKSGVRLSDDVMQAAICMAGNLPAKSLDANFKDQTLQTAKDKFPGGIGLKQIYRIVARERGFHYDGDDVTLDMQRAAFAPIQATTFSTLSLPNILSNTANKFLLEGWGAGEMVWKDITDVVSVRDFKQASFYKLSGSMKYEKVGAAGELKHGTVSEDTYTNQADTYGKMFAITRTDIINDDLGALTRVPLELGYGANDAFNEVFYTEFLNNSAFFASGNSNVSTGVVDAAHVIDTLAAAESKFLLQTKPNGTPLGMLPTVWLVPPGSKRVAMAAMLSGILTGGSSTVPATNTFAGDYKVVCSAFISNAAYTGFSTVKHYLLCNRPGFSTMQTAFLNGRENPVVETAQAAFNVLGVEMRAYHDFGTKKMEYRAGVQGSGA